ncbi:hypothetical protein WMY93_013359 [Mugilogobius chulae]|uniref:G-protein coupled receptors family 1 profile domain-containing protein n=1 Tax=Mugilogobius chulae TaxID=88201 RepID=A0AAW0P1F2_9GOBI
MWTSLGQFCQIRNALSNGCLWTSCRIRVALLLVWIYSFTNAVLPVVGVGSIRLSPDSCVCSLSLLDAGAVSRGVSLWWLCVSMATPLTLTCALQGYVVHVARKQARRGTFRCNDTHCFYVPAHVYERSSYALLLGTGSVLLCWVPFLSVSLFSVLSLKKVPQFLSQGSMFLVLSSCAVSPGVTCLTHTQYRAAARLIWSRLLQLFSRSAPPLARLSQSDLHHQDLTSWSCHTPLRPDPETGPRETGPDLRPDWTRLSVLRK